MRSVRHDDRSHVGDHGNCRVTGSRPVPRGAQHMRHYRVLVTSSEASTAFPVSRQGKEHDERHRLGYGSLRVTRHPSATGLHLGDRSPTDRPTPDPDPDPDSDRCETVKSPVESRTAALWCVVFRPIVQQTLSNGVSAHEWVGVAPYVHGRDIVVFIAYDGLNDLTPTNTQNIPSNLLRKAAKSAPGIHRDLIDLQLGYDGLGFSRDSTV